MGKEAAKTKIRDAIIAKIAEFLEEEYDTYFKMVASGEGSMLIQDENGDKIYANVKVSIPRGTRNGNGGYNAYDGYTEARLFEQEQKDKAREKAVKEAEKQKKIEEDEKKRAEKKALKEANEGLKELRNIKITPEGE